MTSPSRKKRPTTARSTWLRTRADRLAPPGHAATRADRAAGNQPLWLPAGWLAAVFLLSAVAPALGAATTVGADGWRARGAVSNGSPTVSSDTLRTHEDSPRVERRLRPVYSSASAETRGAWRGAERSDARGVTATRRAAVRQVAYEDDIAGPRLRVAGRMDLPGAARRDGYRVAQQRRVAQLDDVDELREVLGQRFGVEESVPTDAVRRDADEADRLFEDLPPEPEPTRPDISEYEPYADDSPEQQPSEPRRSLFDEPEPIDPPAATDRFDDSYDDAYDDLGSAYSDDDGSYADARERDRKLAAESCRDSYERLKKSTIYGIDLNISLEGEEGTDYPFTCDVHGGSVFAPRMWCETTYLWKASGLCHKPLYFEDVALERYGHSWGPCLQPLVSGAHFFGTLPVLPYKMGLKTPNECVYTLGHYRPGSCAPYLLDPIPFTWRAALFQAAGTVGVAAFLP